MYSLSQGLPSLRFVKGIHIPMYSNNSNLCSFYSFKTQSAMHNKPAYDKAHYQQEMMKIKQAQSQVRNNNKCDQVFIIQLSAL